MTLTRDAAPPPEPFRLGLADLSRATAMHAFDVVSGGGGGFVLHELFRKELTPSDVGKLNRLVIPKKNAVMFFPPVHDIGGAGSAMVRDGIDGAEGMLLEFRDRQGRRWEFRYCYWRSSQSFVFTKGWNRFVKAHDLSTKDTVVFHRCEEMVAVPGALRRPPFCVIDVAYTSRSVAAGFETDVAGSDVELSLSSVSSAADGAVAAAVEEEKRGVWLFGVQIS